MTSTRAGHVQVYPDSGEGLSEMTSVRVPIAAGNVPVKLHFGFSNGDYRAFRFDPLDVDGTVTLDDVRIIEKSGRVIREIFPNEWAAANQIASLRVENSQLIINIVPGGTDPQLSIAFDPALILRPSAVERAEAFLNRWLGVLAGVAVLLFALDRLPTRAREKISAARAWAGASPGRALALAAAVAVVARRLSGGFPREKLRVARSRRDVAL